MSCSTLLHRTTTTSPQSASTQRKPSDPATCLLNQVREGFVVNRHKPRMQTPAVSHYPTPALVHDVVLLSLPPCGPHLTPLATGSLKPILLVSPLLEGSTRPRPFALALHLHQRKSSRNLHLQYLAKSHSTSRCQSLITARSDHSHVLGRSGPQSPP
jgi:hypothetical protein